MLALEIPSEEGNGDDTKGNDHASELHDRGSQQLVFLGAEVIKEPRCELVGRVKDRV